MTSFVDFDTFSDNYFSIYEEREKFTSLFRMMYITKLIAFLLVNLPLRQNFFSKNNQLDFSIIKKVCGVTIYCTL